MKFIIQVFDSSRHSISGSGFVINCLKILVLSLLFISCDESGPTNPYEPVYSPEEPDYIANPYFLNADSTLALTPELTATPVGSNAQNQLLMDIRISVRVVNTSDSTFTISPGRATVYTYDPRRRLSTIPLEPGGETLGEEPIPPGSDLSLDYENNPIDKIPYQAVEDEFYAAFTLFLNDVEIVFITQIFLL